MKKSVINAEELSDHRLEAQATYQSDNFLQSEITNRENVVEPHSILPHLNKGRSQFSIPGLKELSHHCAVLKLLSLLGHYLVWYLDAVCQALIFISLTWKVFLSTCSHTYFMSQCNNTHLTFYQSANWIFDSSP